MLQIHFPNRSLFFPLPIRRPFSCLLINVPRLLDTLYVAHAIATTTYSQYYLITAAADQSLCLKGTQQTMPQLDLVRSLHQLVPKNLQHKRPIQSPLYPLFINDQCHVKCRPPVFLQPVGACNHQATAWCMPLRVSCGIRGFHGVSAESHNDSLGGRRHPSDMLRSIRHAMASSRPRPSWLLQRKYPPAWWQWHELNCWISRGWECEKGTRA